MNWIIDVFNVAMQNKSSKTSGGIFGAPHWSGKREKYDLSPGSTGAHQFCNILLGINSTAFE